MFTHKLSKTLVYPVLTVLAISFSAVGAKPAAATPVSKLAGNWQIALIGKTGCGNHGMRVNVQMNANGTGTANIQSHSDCGDDLNAGQTFEISTLNMDGSGKASLSCGPGCGWGFDIQVSPDRNIFNLVNVEPTNPQNYLAGTAIRQVVKP